ncbi:MAG: hypothetical protein GEU71_14550 [Actinobacteria bacterium]|nr:hypothetical protein [Actinomycetota bacterium]
MFVKLEILDIVMEGLGMRWIPGSTRRFTSRMIVMLLAISLIAAACGGDSESEGGDSQGTSPAGLPQPEVTSLKFAVSALAPGPNFAQFAVDEGLFEKYGIPDVEVLLLEGSARSLQALVAGQVQVTIDSAQATLTSLLTDNPLQDVAQFHNSFVDCIYGGPEIKSPDDVAGGRLAVSTLGGQSHAEVVVALTEFGLTSDDVEIVQIGGQDDRVAALRAGSVEAIPAECAVEKQLTSEGMNVLLRLPDVETQMPGSPLTFSKEFIEKNPNTVLAVTAACLEAMQTLFNDTDAAAESYAAWVQVSPEDALLSLEPYKDVAQRDLRWTPEGYATVHEFLVLTNPAVGGVDVRDAYTFEFLERLEELGVYEDLGVPESS